MHRNIEKTVSLLSFNPDFIVSSLAQFIIEASQTTSILQQAFQLLW
jgi:hypothetical protein